MESETIFNIDNLLSPSAKKQFDEYGSVKEKADFLVKLLDFYEENFDTKTIDEINEFYQEKTGTAYRGTFLEDEIKNFVLEYAEYIPDLKKVKALINVMCSKDIDMGFKNETVEKSQEEIDKAKEKIEAEEKEKSTRIYENLVFDDCLSREKSTGTKERCCSVKELIEHYKNVQLILEARKKNERR